ncbi:hydroxypyruvate isomerase [Filimonas zeae]|uniref:Hydroxypyruvate isomerase n=1 Tax=Filimonas zeae TaxID=1737353 RepID=A0A917MVS7_9BACT|nr:TIM barrel protein [Filimonas zeae]MDR6339440.1 hydroxypyruvate isomerase [Filimonas zeae]GGH63592.1 hydroxypyruvate isomerase [Filimonas zeae]
MSNDRMQALLGHISPAVLKGNIHHSVCRWCYNSLSLEELCQVVKHLGFSAVDLVGPEHWPLLKQYGIDSSMCNGAEISLEKGWNNPQYHAKLIENYSAMIPLVAKAGYKNLICFSGNRDGMGEEEGLVNAAKGLQQVAALAERYGVTLVMELLNSKVDHIDYQCDNTQWGVELINSIGSENCKLLYDIYHMQVDEGNICANIQRYHSYIAHYHTAGVPGRHEIDASQELNYPAIMQVIRNTGFTGYVAQEFIPAQPDAIASLKQAIDICDV